MGGESSVTSDVNDAAGDWVACGVPRESRADILQVTSCHRINFD